MRDAFGGVFTMNLLLVFIFIYVAVTAVSLNYAKAFKVKNAVIDFVEEQAIADLDEYFGFANTKSTDFLDLDLARLSYTKTCAEIGYTDNSLIQNIQNLVRPDEYCYKGVVIKEKKREPIDGTNSEIIYYDVKTYANWNLGALNKILALAGRDENSQSPLTGTWTINGEAKVVVKG